MSELGTNAGEVSGCYRDEPASLDQIDMKLMTKADGLGLFIAAYHADLRYEFVPFPVSR